ncbi:hypothetical protein RF371_11610 [Companilactobacillus paralimentarius]|uniref:hypothetical protein n=1 Tax=Companilactobacillus paralimentarius TaxID=83526 RepID=UPI00285336B7|nr:hypothetical protein [Companilactobacillus paralimentarius]MDR4934438.1 hypothetical protein [Companilactobacillus paralimentarius]
MAKTPKAYKNVTFFKINNYKFTKNSEDSKQVYLSNEESKNVLKVILEKALKDKTSDENKDEKRPVIEFLAKNYTCNMEIISGCNNFLDNDTGLLFGRLSKFKDPNEFQQRNEKTNATSSVVVQGNVFEAKSYFLLDTDSMVYCFLRGSSAPSPLALHYMFSEKSKKIDNFDDVFSNSSQIQKADGLEILSKKDYIGSIYYNMAVSDKSKIEQTGLTENEYEELNNQKSASIRVNLIVERNKESIKGNKLISFVKKLLSRGAEKIEIKAKNNDETMQSFFVENNPLALRAKFNYDSELSFEDFEEGIGKDLNNVFLSKSEELKNYLK